MKEQGQQLDLIALIDAYPNGSSRKPGRLELERVKFKAFLDSGTRGKVGWIRHRAESVPLEERAARFSPSGSPA